MHNMLHGKQDLDKDPVAQQSSILDQVPIIDIADLRADSSAAAARTAVDSIAEACGSWGFFQVTNHGISQDLIDEVWRETSSFFALPIDSKMTVLRSRDNPWGFYHNELTKNQRDKKQVYDFTREGTDPIYGQSNRWPDQQDAFKSTMQEYFSACTHLSLQLLEAFCIGLDLPAKFMHADFASNHTGFLRLNYYPVHDPTEGAADDHQEVADLGVHHHTDAGALTVLIQDEVGGLQVHRDGYWYDIPPTPGAIVINTGDMMQVWSNDVYHAPVHRVLAMDAHDRYSLPFFFNPAADARVYPLPSVANEQNPSRYNPIEWGHFRGKRSDGDYADYGTEVQISQFRK
jgi:isopenicillin N synthase-like dioxygenase